MLLSPRPAQAQTGGPWVITLTSPGETGSVPHKTTFPISSPQSVTYPGVGNGAGSGTGPGGTCAIDLDIGVGITVTGTWVGTGPAPTSVSLLESNSASYGGSCSAGGKMTSNHPVADDGLKDPVVSSNIGSGVSSGKHLITVPVNGNTWTFTRTMSAGSHFKATFPAGQGGSMSGGAGFGPYTVGVDSRSVMISSSLGQTSHKSTTHFDVNGIALPDPDVPTSDGTTNATSVKPDPSIDESITYYATPVGPWAASSAYLWNIVEGSPYVSSNSGTFTMPGDPPYSYVAIYSLASTKAGREHVYVHLTDAGDGANATNNYYIGWHDPGENWKNLGARVEVAPLLFGTSDSSQPANGFDNVKIAPDRVDWSVGSHIGGGVVTTGAAVLAVLQPETSPVLIGFLTAFGYTLSVVSPPDPTIYTPQGTLAQFTADVATQQNITAGSTANVFLPGAPRMLPALAKQITVSGNYHDYFTGLLGPGFHFSVQAYRHRFTQNRIGDGYGGQGYYGSVSGSLTTSGSLDYVYNWQ